MGETGCGKTRLIQFMCDLQVPPGSGIKNLIKVKVNILSSAKSFMLINTQYLFGSRKLGGVCLGNFEVPADLLVCSLA